MVELYICSFIKYFQHCCGVNENIIIFAENIQKNIEALTNGETQTSITCYSSFRVTRKSLFEPKWMFVSCLGCVNVEAYEAMDSGECNN